MHNTLLAILVISFLALSFESPDIKTRIIGILLAVVNFLIFK